MSRFRLWLFVLLLILRPGSVMAGSDLYRVDGIDFDGNRTHTANELRLTIQLTEGAGLSRESLKTAASDDVHRLYATGFFSDVRVDIDFREDHTAFVTFIVVEQPQISEIVFSGLHKLDEKSLRDVLTVSAGSFLNDYQLKRSEQSILNRYLDEGYYFAKVTPVKEPLDEGKIRLRFTVEEGDKLKVGRFQVTFDKRMGPFQAWRRTMQIKWNFATGKGAIYSKELLNNDIRKFVDSLKEKGYLLAAIEPRVEIDSRRRRMNVRLIVHMGPRMRVGQISFQGNSVIAESELRKQVTLNRGDYFTFKRFSETLENIRKDYDKIGYLEKEVVSHHDLLEEAGRIDLTFDIQEGQLIYVEKIVVEGLTKTREKVARREIVQEEGQRYDGEKIDLSKRNLNNTGFFENVIVATERGGQSNSRIVVFRLAEGKTGSLQLGMGYSSLSGFVGFTSISKKNFDFFDYPFKKDNTSPYFTGAGQNISTSFELGSKRTNFDVSWTNPWINDSIRNPRKSPRFPTALTTRVFRSGQEYDQYDEARDGGSFRFGKTFGNYLTGFSGYRYENVELSKIKAGAPPSILLLGNRNDAISALSFGGTYDHTDNIFWTTRGVRVTIENEVAGLGGNIDFYKPSLDLRAFHHGGWKNVFAFRFNYSSVDNPFGDDLPPDYEQFYLGGPGTVRGYDDREINVRNAKGQKAGGLTAWFYNVEYRIPVLENTFSILFFHDAGIVSDKAFAFGGNFKPSLGIGLRVQSPMGPIRLDFGYRLSDTYKGSNDKGQFQPHFSFGQQF